MLVHSCIYYTLNDSIVDDHTFDRWAIQLRKLQDRHGTEIGYYDEEFEGWTGDTGFHLPIRDPLVVAKAQRILKLHEELK